jgi:hypothetical protein
LTPEQKQIELQRHRTILLTTLDYLDQHLGESFVDDQHNPITEYYQQQKIQTEKYFQQRRLDRLQQRLANLTKGLQNKDALAFTTYIKERTGYDIDIFEDLRKRVAAIVSQQEIRSQKELNEVGTMFYHLQETSANGEEVEKLKSLLTEYAKQKNHSSCNKRSKSSEVISSVEEDGVEKMMVTISTSPKPKHFEKQESTSPDGKRKLRVVQWSDGKDASTYVTVEFPTASGAVYGLSGICPDVKVWWKDNLTIVIETNRAYTARFQNREVRNFDDVISIEYAVR